MIDMVIKYSQEDIEATVEIIEWYRDDYFNNTAMKNICNEYIEELQSPKLTDQQFNTIELIVDMWID